MSPGPKLLTFKCEIMTKSPSVSIVWWLDAKEVAKIRDDDASTGRDPSKMDLILNRLQLFDDGGDVNDLREDINKIIKS